jgi:hypothetical protein
MNISLTGENLLELFERYNAAIWPMQLAAYLLGAVAVVLAVRKTGYSARVIAAILAFLWLFTGIAFFMLGLAPMFVPAYLFGGVFVVQAGIFLAEALRPRVSFGLGPGWSPIIGLLFLAFSVAGYPLLGLLVDHRYPRSPPFGLTPCPLVVFTFGLLLLATCRLPRRLFAIPLMWALAGVIPAAIGMVEDVAMVAAGVLGTALILARDARDARSILATGSA